MIDAASFSFNQARLLDLIEFRLASRRSGPVLTCDFDVLPLVLADSAFRGRLVFLGELGATGCADEVRHDYVTLAHSH